MSEIPTADWTWINTAADRFERAWKAGQRPRIEEYMLEVDGRSKGDSHKTDKDGQSW